MVKKGVVMSKSVVFTGQNTVDWNVYLGLFEIIFYQIVECPSYP